MEDFFFSTLKSTENNKISFISCITQKLKSILIFKAHYKHSNITEVLLKPELCVYSDLSLAVSFITTVKATYRNIHAMFFG